MITKRQIEKTTVYLIFSLFIQYSAIEIRWVFSHTKLMISWLRWLEKKVGCPCSLVSYSQFFNWLSSISRHVFNVCVHEGARARGRAKWCHKLCAERMRNANVRNHLNVLVKDVHGKCFCTSLYCARKFTRCASEMQKKLESPSSFQRFIVKNIKGKWKETNGHIF